MVYRELELRRGTPLVKIRIILERLLGFPRTDRSRDFRTLVVQKIQATQINIELHSFLLSPKILSTCTFPENSQYFPGRNTYTIHCFVNLLVLEFLRKSSSQKITLEIS